MNLLDMAQAGSLTAESLRSLWDELDDDAIKRKVLDRLGWKFSRKKDRWVSGRKLRTAQDRAHGHEVVLRVDPPGYEMIDKRGPSAPNRRNHE